MVSSIGNAYSFIGAQLNGFNTSKSFQCKMVSSLKNDETALFHP